MNWDFVAHIIRDVLPTPIRPVIYGNDDTCLDIFRTSQHGMNFFMLYSGDPTNKLTEGCYPFDISDAVLFFGSDFCDLFVSFKENSMFPIGIEGSKVVNLYPFMKSGGLVFLVNPDTWAYNMESAFDRRDDYIKEIKSYSMFRDERVLVYEKL